MSELAVRAARIDLLVELARKLRCIYPRDDCDKHVGQEGFTRCQYCVARDLADEIASRR